MARPTAVLSAATREKLRPLSKKTHLWSGVRRTATLVKQESLLSLVLIHRREAKVGDLQVACDESKTSADW